MSVDSKDPERVRQNHEGKKLPSASFQTTLPSAPEAPNLPAIGDLRAVHAVPPALRVSARVVHARNLLRVVARALALAVAVVATKGVRRVVQVVDLLRPAEPRAEEALEPGLGSLDVGRAALLTVAGYVAAHAGRTAGNGAMISNSTRSLGIWLTHRDREWEPTDGAVSVP